MLFVPVSSTFGARYSLAGVVAGACAAVRYVREYVNGSGPLGCVQEKATWTFWVPGGMMLTFLPSGSFQMGHTHWSPTWSDSCGGAPVFGVHPRAWSPMASSLAPAQKS